MSVHENQRLLKMISITVVLRIVVVRGTIYTRDWSLVKDHALGQIKTVDINDRNHRAFKTWFRQVGGIIVFLSLRELSSILFFPILRRNITKFLIAFK